MANTSITAKASAASNPTVRYVYLVQDASDALKMGGTLQNTYTTFQTAYNAANALQVSLGGSNVVVIMVGNITAAVAGSLTLTANYNNRVYIQGINPTVSILGSIIANNNAGNGYTIGSSSVNALYISNVRIANITSNATGVAGNGGTIFINANGVRIDNIESLSSNAAGSTGNIGIEDLYGATYINRVSNNISVGGSTGNTGSLTITATVFIKVLAIQNVGGNLFYGVSNGATTLTNVQSNTIQRVSSTNITLKNCIATYTNLAISAGTGGINMEDCSISEYIQFVGTTSNKISLKNCRIGTDSLTGAIFTGPNSINNFNTLLVWNTKVVNSYSLTDPLAPSLLLNNVNTTFITDSVINNIDDFNTQTGTASSVIYFDNLPVSATARFINSSVGGGAGSIDAASPFTIDTFSTYIESTLGVNITVNPL